ncbi:DUF6298 domain-containing protein [Allorhodopirellula solitaria]|uniref:DUF6298 domain-containing protein n=1 Tax=Allorhodopirellula solitaria TaxID=2527987 RepID=A0A5C5XQG7_9BACT|nr:DUF6298 domain-containing protein [Allorhodopirellula solitaria]TWT64849.1 hypothetical protein CA85_36340 [Allorhodopirellula solitaria]
MNQCVRYLLLCALAFSATGRLAAEQPLRPSAEYPWYWSFRGEPVLLLGGSDDDNLFQWPESQLIAQLERLSAAGGNVIRNTMSDRHDKGFEVYPFKRLASGKYDLDRWNVEYWTRFERMLRETSKRNIVVQIEIWDRFDYTDQGGQDHWQGHPYHPRNNVNYTAEQSGFAQSYPDHPGANKQPFFFTTPQQRNNQVVLPYQQRFVSKLLEHILPYDHVLYCIDNETKGEPAWSRYWAQFIKQRAAAKHKTLDVTEMWDDWNLTSPQHKQTFDHPELYNYVDVSQNNHNHGQEHWDNFLSVREYLRVQPRPMNTTKTYGASGNKFGHTDQDGIERFWRHLLAGAASMRFHRPSAGLGLNDQAVASIQAARELEARVPLWSVEAANELLSDREDNEAYLAADPGRAYAIYFPAGGSVHLDRSGHTRPLTIHWINIETGEAIEPKSLPAAASIRIEAPGDGNWAAAMIE